MSSGMAAEMIAMIAIFFGGVTCGAIVSVSRAIRREDRRLSLTGAPPDAAAGGTRVMTGAGSRDVVMVFNRRDAGARPRGAVPGLRDAGGFGASGAGGHDTGADDASPPEHPK